MQNFKSTKIKSTDTSYEIIILGSGGSSGVPTIEDGWGVCDKNNKKNYRTRTSVYIKIYNHKNNTSKAILFDVSPDFRYQALSNNITVIDSILFSHPHADHIFGIDDLRGMNRLMGKSIDCYCSKETLGTIQSTFGYIFTPSNSKNTDTFYKPALNFYSVDYNQTLTILNDIKILTTQQNHNKIDTMGYIIDNTIAYIPDFVSISNKSIEAYSNLDTLIISAFTRKHHSSHMLLEGVLKLIEQLNPRQSILIHMGNSMDYDYLIKTLPNNVIPAYDGITITV